MKHKKIPVGMDMKKYICMNIGGLKLTVKTFLVFLLLCMMCGCRYAHEVDGGGMNEYSQENMRDVEMLVIKTAYESERSQFEAAHRNTKGGAGWAMEVLHWKEFNRKYSDIVRPWLKETSSEEEWRLIEEYAPFVGEALVPRKRLLEKIEIWNRIKGVKGAFAGQQISFNDGIASYQDRKQDGEKLLGSDEYRDGFPMKLRIDRMFVWTTHGMDYALAHSDCAALIDDEIAGNCYGCSDANRSAWFLRFKDGELIDSCNLGNTYLSDRRQIFYFIPENNRLEIMNIETGDLKMELSLSLWEGVGR